MIKTLFIKLTCLVRLYSLGKIIDGELIAQNIINSISHKINHFNLIKSPPILGFIQVGNHPSSHSYIERTKIFFDQAGINAIGIIIRCLP